MDISASEHVKRVLGAAEQFNAVVADAKRAGLTIDFAALVNKDNGGDKIIVRGVSQVLHREEPWRHVMVGHCSDNAGAE